MVDIENKIFNGSKINYTNHIVDFYVSHLNPVYLFTLFPWSCWWYTSAVEASCHAQLYPSTIGLVVNKLYACTF